MNARLASGPHSRRGAVETSAEAAESIARNIGALHREVLRVMGHGSYTADEIALVMRRSVLAIRPRIAELRDAGLIYDTGKRAKNASGKRAAVWRRTFAHEQGELPI